MNAVQLAVNVAAVKSPGVGLRVLVASLMGFYILLPLDRGFPAVPLFGRPLNSAIAATLIVFCVLLVRSRGALLAYLREPYCVIQSAYFCLLVASALRAPSPLSALHWSVLYYCTFVLNYVVLRYITSIHGTHWLSAAVAGLGVAAAGVAIVQGVIGIPLPMSDAWFENYFGRPPENYALATARASGTMNNPILFCLLMALVIPYAFDLSRRSARALALFIIMFAAGLSGSRTSVFVVAVFAAGAVFVYRWRAVKALPAVGAGLVLLAVALGWLTPAGQGSRVTFLTERSGLTAGAKTALDSGPDAAAEAGLKQKPATASRPKPATDAELSAALGINLRKGALWEGLREMTQEWGPLTWIFGRGAFSVAAVGKRIRPWYNTVDNVYLSVLYERGLAGLILFVGAFISFLFVTRRASAITVHWFAPVTLMVAGFSFCWDAYSMFNILVVGSMALAMWHQEQLRAPKPEAAANHRDRFAVPTIAILTNVLPSYRRGFYDRLFARQDIAATVYCQSGIPGMNVQPIHDIYPGHVKVVKAISMRGEALAWQFTPWRAVLFGYDVVVVAGNPRVLSQALTATLLRLFRRNVMLWTMGHSYGANRLTERTRLLWTRMFDRLFVYTDAEVRYLRQQGFTSQDIISMNNGLDQARIDAAIAAWPGKRLDDWRRTQDLTDRAILLSCARLDPKNKFEQVIAALPAIRSRVPQVTWCVIGSGTEEARLRSRVRDAGLADHVRFVGELYEEEALAPWFLSADVFVHPGAIGLSLLHAFGYGLPVVTHGNAEHHGPEFAAFEAGRSGRSYREDDADGLASAAIALLQDESGRARMKRHVQDIVRTQYNVDVMVERFVAAAKSAVSARHVPA
jgi:glycosyltransferase involved in cell wall biosynthesis/O-antigen ligase